MHAKQQRKQKPQCSTIQQQSQTKRFHNLNCKMQRGVKSSEQKKTEKKTKSATA